MDLCLAPSFLIAMPQLVDPNFNKTVVLILHHSEEGAMGLVVNRRTEVPLATFCEEHDLPNTAAADGDFLHLGGPCELQRVFILHEHHEPSYSSTLIGAGLYVTTDPDTVRAVLTSGRGQIRFLLGYAGWGPRQLEREIGEGSWLNAGLDVNRVLHTSVDQIWSSTVKDLGIDPSHLVISTERH